MIRFRRLTLALLNAWLVDQCLPNQDGRRYRLRLWREEPAALPALKDELIAYLDEAFDDARQKLRRGFEDDLSPFDDPATDPAANYPARLHRITLQGYLGELLACLAVEQWGAHGHDDWGVPAFLFRFHDQEFQHLEQINERLRAGQAYDPDQQEEQRPGRTGDDGLAFRKDGANVITDVIVLEAKCLERHRSDKIVEAHEKLSAGTPLPPGVRELINLLDEYESPEAEAWQEALLRLRMGGYQNVRRYDGVAYACGAAPAGRGGRRAWMPEDRPHAAYAAGRRLEALEFQFRNVGTVVDVLFRGA